MGRRFVVGQLRKVVRQEPLSCRAIRSGGEDRQYPSEIALRIHADELACGDHGINHRGAPAGGRVPDEEVIAKSHFSRSEAALDGILVDMHVTAADFRVSRRGAAIGRWRRSPRRADCRRRRAMFERAELALQAFQDRLRLGVAQQAPLIVSQALHRACRSMR